MKLTESDKKLAEKLMLNNTEMMIFKSYREVKQLEKHHKDGTIYYSIVLVRFQSYIEMAKVAGTITWNPACDEEERIAQIMKMATDIVFNR